ncbi:MAG: AMP-dependent synthetase and ligase [Actinomycetia bacterium]|nr:AMP-dependent synthetase and ligase [Actinomycetes bacterium]
MSGFWKYAQEDPDALSVVDPNRGEYTAGEVLARANQMVHALRAVGLQKGDTVAAVLPNGVNPMWVYLAALQAGWYYVPINYRLSPAEIAYILQDSEAKAFVSDEGFSDVVIAAADEAGIPASARLGTNVAGFGSLMDALDAQPTTMPADRSTGAAMHYTSGTTGRPKGVKRALAQIDPDTAAELFSLLLGLFGIQQRDGNVHLSTSPNYHTAVTTFAGNALHMGHAVVFMDKWDPAEALRLIEKYNCTHTHMVPTQFKRMLQLPEDVKSKADVSAMKWAIHAAAPCPVDVKKAMLAWWGPVIWEYYAATEGGGTIASPEDWMKYPGTVGKTWPISELKITDDDGNRVETGTPGTVWMRMSSGTDFEYKGDKAKTDDSHDAEGYFTVGDIGYLNEDEFLFLCDRKSDMIIAGGVNIYPAEIEGEILSHPLVADVAVFGIPDEDMGEAIKAVVQAEEGVAADDALRTAIMDHLRDRLGKYKWPRSIDFVDELPREPTGKLLKRKLRDPYWEGRDRAI